jgi:hypothetical protein
MKKVTIIVGAILASLSLSPAEAADQKTLAIIDSYFDNASVCVATVGCNTNIATKPRSLTDPANHGNAMVEVAKRQNPSIGITSIKSANTYSRSSSEMSTGDFIRALSWVDQNSANIGAVSVSRFFNAPNSSNACSPNASGTAEFGGVSNADKKIRGLVESLKQKGIPVFAATGNTVKKAVDYPACILATNSVGVGSINKLGVLVAGGALDINTDYLVPVGLANQYKSSTLGLIPNTTSSATVAVATKYVSGLLDNKFVNVLQ